MRFWRNKDKEPTKEEFLGRLKHGSKYDRYRYYEKLQKAIMDDDTDVAQDILNTLVEDIVKDAHES